MADRVVQTEQAREMLVRFIQNHALPFTCTVTAGKQRSTAQNRTQRKWAQEIAEQLGDQTQEQVRAYIKLHIGVPILREENEAFRLRYDAVVKPLSYEQKIALMMEPLDLPVTRLFTTKQHARFLDEVHRYFSERGIVLTDPEDMRRVA
jgi:hypothetical protein